MEFSGSMIGREVVGPRASRDRYLIPRRAPASLLQPDGTATVMFKPIEDENENGEQI